MWASFKKRPSCRPLSPKGDQGKKKPGDLGRNREVYRQHHKELKPGVGKT